MEPTAPLLTFAYNVIKDIGKHFSGQVTHDPYLAAKSLENHFSEIEYWSSRIQFLGMSEAVDIDGHTIALTLSSQPRRFFSQEHAQEYDETQLFGFASNIVVLGDPGSGKTTTAKRLIRQVLYKAEDSTISQEVPLLVVARSIESNHSLIDFLSKIFGASWIVNSDPKIDQTEKTRDERKAFVFDVLGKMSSVLVVDGIDEIPHPQRIRIENDLAELSSRRIDCRIFVTCRSGDFSRPIHAFKVVEILPLSPQQIIAIVNAWSMSPVSFVQNLYTVVYSDLFNRPLYLCQIILVFNVYKNLPVRPSELCRRICTLMIEKWDRERAITRTSVYVDFGTEQKLDFLGNLAYELLARRMAKRFTHDQLIDVYWEICSRFQLPPHEAPEVVDEIESHCGLMVQSSIDSFEFGHLSLQEYLAAMYLVKQPSLKAACKLFNSWPAITAIAASLSSDSTSYFYELIIELERFDELYEDAVLSFLRRIQIEKPRFLRSFNLGVAFVLLASKFGSNSNIRDILLSFMREDEIFASIRSMAGKYTLVETDSELHFVRSVALSDGDYHFLSSFALREMVSDFTKIVGRGSQNPSIFEPKLPSKIS